MKNNILITRGVVCFPNIKTSISIGRQFSINTINDAYKSINKNLIITAQKDASTEQVNKLSDIYEQGVLTKILEIKHDNNEIIITVLPISRVIINNIEINNNSKIIKANYLTINDKTNKNDDSYLANNLKTLIELLKRYDQSIIDKTKISLLNPQDKKQMMDHLDFVYMIANELPMNYDLKQKILASNSLIEKINIICNFIAIPNDKARVDNEINNKMHENMNKQQKEYYLREKLRILKEELGEISNKNDDADNLRKRLNNNPYPQVIKEKIGKEINRLETANPQEVSMIRSYIEWVLDIPWWQEAKDNNDINKVKKVLDQSHYGLEKAKERIIEYLAIRAKAKNSKAPIICLVGPPGVGKSTLAMSIAKALNKPFVKMALGGMKDESEIRGHRRTYVGSMPGRIIKCMKKAGVINPLFLLDELDKMDSDYRGDPASAMLEVLDPEQNSKFSDNYIEEDYDLGKVMFVATANYANQIPEALYDRLEIIELTSYTELEKLAIAKMYLIPRVYKDCGLTANDLTFTDKALTYIIRHYTLEAGVRELERQIKKIARKFVVKQLTIKNYPSQNIDVGDLESILDKPIYDYTMKEKNNIPGVVNGMAYTSAGGDLLQIEATSFKGKGQVLVTGNLKKTMEESAEVALGFVKTNAKKYGLEKIDFDKINLHVHVPCGGIPKDGPSAGVTLTTALISCLSHKSVNNKLSMTGEITLRGKVMIIGGVKEKIISAYRGGVNTVILPLKDERFLKDIPNEVLDYITIYLVDEYDEIYNIVFKNKVLQQTKIIIGKKVKK